MLDLDAVRSTHAEALEQLEFEVNTLHREFQSTDWYGNQRHFPYAHYGYMMEIFSQVDLLSRYWAGYDRPGQTRRMVGFFGVAPVYRTSCKVSFRP